MNYTVLEEIEILLKEAQLNCARNSGQKLNLIHFFIHELSVYFLSNASIKILLYNNNNIDKTDLVTALSELQFFHRNGVLLELDMVKKLSNKKKLLFCFFKFISLLTSHKLARAYIGTVSFKFINVVFQSLKNGFLPFPNTSNFLYFFKYSSQRKQLENLCKKLLKKIKASNTEENLFWSD